MSFNVENLFDTEDDPTKKDEEFTPKGSKEWDEDKLSKKLQNLGSVVTSINNPNGTACPDVLALVEVENENVLSIWKRRSLKVCGYKQTIVADEHYDPRGIQVALMTKLDLAAEPEFHFTYSSGRYILEVPLQVEGHRLHVFVNHWKSRLPDSGDGDNGQKKRAAAAELLRSLISGLLQKNPNMDVVAVGDFNDESESASLKNHLGVSSDVDSVRRGLGQSLLWQSSMDLFNQLPFVGDPTSVENQKLFKLFSSTYHFHRDNAYNHLDHILVSKGLLDTEGFSFKQGSYQTIRHPKGTENNFSPLPFLNGPRIRGGISDHFPVLARFKVNN